MLRRIDADEHLTAPPVDVSRAEALMPAVIEAENQSGFLPGDHPRWVSDAVAISRAARRLVAKLKPVLLVVRSMWDHPLRCVAIAGRRVSVDASGSYRIET